MRGFAWAHGPKEIVLHDGPSLGIRGMWISMFRSYPDRNLLPFEDDIEVSQLYYWWLVRALHQYGPLETDAQVRERRLAGVALYTPRLNEIQYPQARWHPDESTDQPTFLLQVPCSWGGLFFGGVWREFVAFYHERVRPPFFDFSQEATQKGIARSA